MKNNRSQMNTTIKLYSLSYSEYKTYVVVGLLIIGNILFPSLFHFIPQGGLLFLPIYFFTLLGTYKYGIKAGIITAILSPLLNHLLLGMPPLEALPGILIKSVLLVGVASIATRYYKNLSISVLTGVVLTYQIIGTLLEWLQTGSWFVASQDFRLAVPGMLLQIFGVYGILRLMNKYGY